MQEQEFERALVALLKKLAPEDLIAALSYARTMTGQTEEARDAAPRSSTG